MAGGEGFGAYVRCYTSATYSCAGISARNAGSARLVGGTLLAALCAFLQEHRRCGDLDSAIECDRVWMTCTCGAVINRSADDD